MLGVLVRQAGDPILGGGDVLFVNTAILCSFLLGVLVGETGDPILRGGDFLFVNIVLGSFLLGVLIGEAGDPILRDFHVVWIAQKATIPHTWHYYRMIGAEFCKIEGLINVTWDIVVGGFATIVTLIDTHIE